MMWWFGLSALSLLFWWFDLWFVLLALCGVVDLVLGLLFYYIVYWRSVLRSSLVLGWVGFDLQGFDLLRFPLVLVIV